MTGIFFPQFHAMTKHLNQQEITFNIMTLPNSNSSLAKSLRKSPSLAESKAWELLRGRNCSDLKFKRQVPIGPYVVDFLCVEAQTIIELDGESHSERQEYDQTRTSYFEEHGYAVVRFINEYVLSNPEDFFKAVGDFCLANREKNQDVETG